LNLDAIPSPFYSLRPYLHPIPFKARHPQYRHHGFNGGPDCDRARRHARRSTSQRPKGSPSTSPFSFRDRCNPNKLGKTLPNPSSYSTHLSTCPTLVCWRRRTRLPPCSCIIVELPSSSQQLPFLLAIYRSTDGLSHRGRQSEWTAGCRVLRPWTDHQYEYERLQFDAAE
jgi:hypothetical protein